jgi:hypothetical protein
MHIVVAKKLQTTKRESKIEIGEFIFSSGVYYLVGGLCGLTIRNNELSYTNAVTFPPQHLPPSPSQLIHTQIVFWIQIRVWVPGSGSEPGSVIIFYKNRSFHQQEKKSKKTLNFYYFVTAF